MQIYIDMMIKGVFAQKVGRSLVVHCILWGGQRGVAVSYVCSMLFV